MEKTHMNEKKQIVSVTQIIHFNRVFHYKPSILGYHHFRKHQYVGSGFVDGTLLNPPFFSSLRRISDEALCLQMQQCRPEGLATGRCLSPRVGGKP